MFIKTAHTNCFPLLENYDEKLSVIHFSLSLIANSIKNKLLYRLDRFHGKYSLNHGRMVHPIFAADLKDYSFELFEVYREQMPDRIEKCSAYLITGSAHSVYKKIGFNTGT